MLRSEREELLEKLVRDELKLHIYTYTYTYIYPHAQVGAGRTSGEAGDR
jgi:hypothetical protein